MDFYELRRKSAATPRLEMILAVLDAPHHQPRPRCSALLHLPPKKRERERKGFAWVRVPATPCPEGSRPVPAMRYAVTPRCTALPSIKVRRRSQGVHTFRAGGGAGLDEVAVAPAGLAPRFGPVPIPLPLCAAWDTHGAPRFNEPTDTHAVTERPR